MLPAVIIVSVWTGALLHREVHEAGNSIQTETVRFAFEIPTNALVAIPYSLNCGIIHLAECLVGRKSFDGFIRYDGKDFPSGSATVAFLPQECFGVAAQLDRINSVIHDGVSLVLIPNMEEGLATDKAQVLRNSVKDLCKEKGVTVVNEVYHEHDL